MQLKRTNLGKWRYETQTYFEHTESVWVFRQVFLSPFFKLLSSELSADTVQETQAELLHILRLETVYHDYDKLFVPENRVKDMLKFDWHANLSAPENEPALEALLTELKGKDSEWDKMLIDREQLKPILQNANVCHNGSFTIEKWKLARRTYDKFFREQFGWSFNTDVLDRLTNLLAYSIRVADAVASAKDQSAAYKSDVSRFTEFLRSEMPEAKIIVLSVLFNNVFSESASASVLQGYYTLYDAYYRALTKVLEPEGSLIFDSASVITGIILSEQEPESFRRRLLESIAGDLSKAKASESIVQINHAVIDCISNATNYDELLKRQILSSIYGSYVGASLEIGFPCSSCGRNIVKSGVEAKELNETIVKESTSLEGRGDFGSIKTIGRHILQAPAVDKSDMFVCDDCRLLSNVAGGHYVKTTVAISTVKRSYEPVTPSLGLTNDRIEELPKLIYSFKIKQQIVESINQNLLTKGQSTQLIAKSFVILDYTTTIEKMFSTFVEPLQRCLQEQAVDLPDGRVTYSADFGVRIGTGAMLFGGRVIDNEYLRCVVSFKEYYRRFSVIAELNAKIRTIGSQEKETELLFALMNTSGLPTLTRRLSRFVEGNPKERERRGQTLEWLFEFAAFIQSNPDAVEWLRTIRQAEKIK